MKPGEKCEACNLVCTKKDHTGGSNFADPCMGILPGVIHACCGHGEEDRGYVFFENGVTIRFDLINTELKGYSKHHNFTGRDE